MKKFIILAISCFLIIGAAFAHINFDDYYASMKELQKNKCYTLKLQIKTGKITYNYDIYAKGNWYKAVLHTDIGGVNTASVSLYNKNGFFNYTDGKNYAISMYGDEKNPEVLKLFNPALSLFDFKENVSSTNYETASSKNPIFANDNDNKNGFSCRLIKFSNDREVCVNDKYGIGVYEKYATALISKGEVVNNILVIKTDEIPDSFFELPKNMEIKTMDGIIKDAKAIHEKEKREYESWKTINF